MILQSLFCLYESLAEKDQLPKFGWTKQKVAYALEIDDAGQLIAYHPLSVPEERGKKSVMVPRTMTVPTPFVRSSGICANFLCDNAKYLLGIDTKKADRGPLCFQAAKERHETILSDVSSPAALAILSYFRTFDCRNAAKHPILAGAPEDLFSTANLVFLFNGNFVLDDPSLIDAWDRFYRNTSDGSSEKSDTEMRCLLTGEKTLPQRTHSPIKGVPGAKSTGAPVVSFNVPAFCSYGRDGEQNLNAPVGKYGAFAYTSALNYLIADKKHSKLFGDTLLLYWAEDAESAYQDIFGELFDPDPHTITDRDLNELMKKIRTGQPFEWNAIPMDPANHFYLLGISPNAARLSVRFFYQDTFGAMIRHLKDHYDRLCMTQDHSKLPQMLPLWRLLKETVNPNAQDKSASPQLAGDMLRAILTGGRYPATMYQQLQLRIRADREINHVRAAIIKATLLKNNQSETIKEVLTMDLNESTTYQPYILGRLFAVLERIQERASGVTTIRDKYFTSAASTPAVVFPLIVDLAGKHLRKMDGGEKVYYEKMLQSLLCRIESTYTTHQSLADQGVFQLGYYHQKQKFYEKKTADNEESDPSSIRENEEIQ